MMNNNIEYRLKSELCSDVLNVARVHFFRTGFDPDESYKTPLKR